MKTLAGVEESVRARLVEKLAASLQGPIPGGTPRRVHGTVQFPGKATAVVGMRRAGKTTFLHQVRGGRLAAGVPRECLPYLDFEDEQLAGLQVEHLGLLVEEYYRRFPSFRGRETVTWCLDEIQVVPGWERFVRRVLASEKVEVWLSGSSSALLSDEIATSMRGRGWKVVIHPFGFDEALHHKGLPVPTAVDFLAPAERSALERAFLDYLAEGGFPEAQGLDAPTRTRLLRDYVDVAVLRDVVERHGVTNVAGLRWMVRHLLGSPATLFSVEKFHAALRSQGFAIGKDTVHELLGHLEDCFLVRIAWMESASERQRMVNPRKAYPIDPGLVPVFRGAGSVDLGHALETVVRLELERRGWTSTYVRTPGGLEVDFLARSPDGTAELIQVCADATGPETLAREFRALEQAATIHPEAGRRLLTATRDGLPPSLPPQVLAQPAYEWLLTPASGIIPPNQKGGPHVPRPSEP